MKRSSGILMPLFSLPSKYGCGTLGKEAYNFTDWLVKAGQSYWQMLPINHPGYGDSPYCCYSSFAGNPLFIDLDILKDSALITQSDIDAIDWGDAKTADAPSRADYSKLWPGRRVILKKAFDNRLSAQLWNENDFSEFKNSESRWLNPYSEFMSAKEGEAPEFYKFVQYNFYKQWREFRSYANSKGVKLIGDVPVYVPLDSADVLAEPEFFMLDEKHVPTDVAGVPPDYFNEKGQLWGNPLYNWDRMKADGFGWWIRRIDGTLKLFDLVRIDHFRGFDSYWAVPYGETDARNGRWMQGPGLDFVNVITGWFGGEHFIAEDLGILTDSVRSLLKNSGLPGMKVLEFAFSPDMTSAYLPHNYERNSVCYVGTHDNATALEWAETADAAELKCACEYCGCDSSNINEALIRIGMESVSDLFICQIQDWLGLGKGYRTNTPGTVGGNWNFRITENQLTDELAEKIKRMTTISGRA